MSRKSDVNSEHQNKIFICERCQGVFRSHDDLNDHRKLIHGVYQKEDHSKHASDSEINRKYKKYYQSEKRKKETKDKVDGFGRPLLKGRKEAVYNPEDFGKVYLPADSNLPDYFERAGRQFYKCKNCSHYIRFLTDSYEHFSLPLKKRIKIPKKAIPLVLCPICGMNVFKDNRLKLYRVIKNGGIKTEEELKDLGFDIDVINSVKGKIKRKLRNIGGVKR